MEGPGLERHVLVVGVSVRSIVQSASRVGFFPHAVDRFGDVDTRAASQGWRPLPRRISGPAMARCLAELPVAPVVWGSPFENYPKALEVISKTRELWGAYPSAVRLVRSPMWLSRVLAEEGLWFPKTWEQHPHGGRTGQALVKPKKSGGGLGVHFVGSSRMANFRAKRGVYYQEFVPGRTISGLFWSDGRVVRLLAVAEQLVGMEEFGASGFVFCGSILPARIAPRTEGQLSRAGEVVARRARLRGLFGVDGVVRGEDFYTLEVNPRWTASVELFELASGLNAFNLHIGAFAARRFGPMDFCKGGGRGCEGPVWGRAIVYARKPAVFSWRPVLPIGRQAARQDAWVSDVPVDGTELKPREPVLSLFCAGSTPEVVREQLVLLAGEVYRAVLE